MVPKLNKVMSLQGGNSNQVNPNHVTSVKRQRAGNKIYLNRLIKETKNLINTQENVGQPDKAKDIANREMLSTKIQFIKSYDEKILDSIDTEADVEREIFESSGFAKSISKLIISINMWLKSHDNEAMSDGTVQNSNLQNSNISVRPRLTRQEIPPFSCDPLQLQSFWEIFDSSIHSNTSLPPINKFSYLKTLFTGKAKDALNSLELTSGNYDKAVAILKSRFGDPQVVIQSNIDILLALRQISCTYCKQNHPSNKCSVVNDVQPRNKFLLTKPDILTVYV